MAGTLMHCNLPSSFQSSSSPTPFRYLSKSCTHLVPLSQPCIPLRHLTLSQPSFLPLFLVRSSANDAVETQRVDSFLPSGEWPENFSILNFEDLSKHYEPALFKAEAQPSTFLADVMSRTIYTARPNQLLEEIDHYFLEISGLPVIDNELKCIGVLSKKDKIKASNGLKSRVSEVMTSPPITLSADKTVSDAAILMLKNKIHRIPIVNGSNQVVGIVTRTDIFSALEGAS